MSDDKCFDVSGELPFIEDRDVGDEQEVGPALVSIENLTEREFKAVSQTIAAALFAHFPHLWMQNVEDEEARILFMEVMLASADSALSFLTEAEAESLKAKLSDSVRSLFTQKGLDLDSVKNQLITHLGKIELQVNDHPSADEEGTPDGNTETQEAERGSEPEPGQS